MKQVLIIGNGFDLACRLKSSYSDFFNWRFKKLFGSKKHEEICMKIINDIDSFNLTSLPADSEFMVHIDFFNELKSNWDTSSNNITRWDCIFLLAKYFLEDNKNMQWQDVENIIYNVVSIALIGNSFKTNLLFNKDRKIKGQSSKVIFFLYVSSLVRTEINSKESVAAELLNSLYNFENAFAEFLLKDSHFDSSRLAENLFKSLIDPGNEKLPSSLTVDVLSFNYTFPNFNERLNIYLKDDIKNLNVNSWRNIHGMAKNAEMVSEQNSYRKPCAPIFGIDNHDILKDNISNDLRIMFTKSYRLIDNNVNGIRNKNKINYEDSDIITVYGHSLGRADYSYFETIFDENDLYNSITKLKIYYYEKVGDNNIENKRECINRAVSLLNNYGQTLGDTHGENIVNKMILEDRLEVSPSSSLAMY